MVWDLRAALLKKGEVESARLDDFAFRLRARAMRLLADRIGRGLSGEDLCRAIATEPDDAILAALADRFPDLSRKDLAVMHAACEVEARTALLAELGDPTPHRLA
jgi:hypothetical protein